jgi:uncharacterized repeat protein (TIGR03803 family)
MNRSRGWLPALSRSGGVWVGKARRPGFRRGRRRLRLVLTGLEDRRLLTAYSYQVLGSFDGADNGEFPLGTLAFDAQGDAFGTAWGGGANDDGTVYEIVHGQPGIVPIVTFNGANGIRPASGLLIDAQGNLYGTTGSGGANGDGTVFEIAAGTHTLTTLASFTDVDKAGPGGQLALDAEGDVFGITGGDYSAPDYYVYEVARGSGTVTNLAPLADAAPFGLTIDPQGNLYGELSGGDYGYGGVFELFKGASTITPLASFTGLNGVGPVGLAMDAQGNVYGTTLTGGPTAFDSYPYLGADGTVFEIAAGSDTVTTLGLFH